MPQPTQAQPESGPQPEAPAPAPVESAEPTESSGAWAEVLREVSLFRLADGKVERFGVVTPGMRLKVLKKSGSGKWTRVQLDNGSVGSVATNALRPYHSESSGKKLGPTVPSPKLDAHGGVGFTTLSFTGKDSTDKTRTGFAGGVGFELPLSTAFSLGTGLDYSQRGMIIDSSTTTSINLRYDYLAIPVLAKYSFGNSAIRPFALTGVDLGYLIGTAARLTTNGTTTDVPVYSSNYRRWASDLQFGGGVEFPTGQSSHITLDARYYLGISNISLNPSTPISHRGIQLMLGYQWDLEHAPEPLPSVE